MFSAKTVQLLGPAARQSRDAAAAAVLPHPGVKTGERYVHLDALRACLMFWGILVHVSNVAPNTFFQTCASVSHLVRMEAFFIISGFLAYMLLQKYGGGKTVRKRLVAVGVPLVAALLLLNPVTKYLAYVFYVHPISFADYVSGHGTANLGELSQAGLEAKEIWTWPGNWFLHLWFLLALFFYSMLAPLLGKAVDLVMRDSQDRMPRPWTLGRLAPLVPGLKFLMICLLVGSACVGWRVILSVISPGKVDYVVSSIGNFLPYYTLGMVLFASHELRKIFASFHWVQLILSGCLYYFVHRVAGEDPGKVFEALLLMAKTYVALSLSSTLFWAAERFVKSEKPVARFLSEAAYTVYLFHFVVIYLFALLLRGAIPHTGLLLFTIAACTFATTIGLHAFVIRPLPPLAFLFNGKPPKRAKK